MLHYHQCLCFWWRTFVCIADILIHLSFFLLPSQKTVYVMNCLMLLEYFAHESLSSVLLNTRKFAPVYISHSSLSVAKNNIEKSTYIYMCVCVYIYVYIYIYIYIYIYKFTHGHTWVCMRAVLKGCISVVNKWKCIMFGILIIHAVR